MKKYVLLLTAAILFGMVAPVLAQEGDLHGDFGYTYDTMHVWRGFMTWGQHSGSNLFIDLDFFGSGFGMSIEDHMANGTARLLRLCKNNEMITPCSIRTRLPQGIP